MNLEKMKCFVDVVKYNSFTKAADANYITQAAVSQQISSIEEEIGFKCFERTKAGLVITKGGASFYNSTLRILSLYSQSLSRARCVAHNLSGNIPLGIWPGIDSSHIYTLIDELVRIYPNIRIVIRSGSPVDFRHKTKASKLALAIVMPYDFYDIDIPGTSIEPLITCHYDLYVSNSNPLSRFNEVSIDQLRNEKFVVQGKNSIGVKTYSHVVVEQMQNRHLLKPAFFVSNFETQQMLVAINQGIMILPEYCCPTDTTHIKKLRLLDYPEECIFSIVWNSEHPSPGLSKFAELLKNHFRSLQEKRDTDK